MIKISSLHPEFKYKCLTGQINLSAERVYCSLHTKPDEPTNIDTLKYTTELVNFEVEYPNKLLSPQFKLVGPFTDSTCYWIVVHTADTIILSLGMQRIGLDQISELMISWENTKNIIAEL